MPELNGGECVSDLRLDEWLAEELDPAAQAQVGRHLADCAACGQRRAARDAERTAFLATADSFAEHGQLVARQRLLGHKRAARWPAAIAGLSVAAALALLVLYRPEPPMPPVQSKGDAHLGFYLKRAQRTSRGQSGQVVHPDDLLRFTYTASQPLQLAILNWDGTEASIYFAPQLRSARIDAGAEVLLDFSVQLDRKIGREWVYGVFCSAPFEVEPLRARLARDAVLKPDAGCSLDVIALDKRAPP